MALLDQQVRQQALDPSRSFIVQAPAGSGKTELLVRRILVLLTLVDQPEEIVAITFTRKAAAEMRERVISVLATVAKNSALDSSSSELHELARKVIKRDSKKRWNLTDHPSRLRIQTIDALCMALTRQMPWLSRFGANPAITDDPEELYRDAAKATLEHLGSSRSDWQDSVRILFKNFDNDYARIQSLLMNMLTHRDQWLRYVTANEDDVLPRRERLQRAWTALVSSVLSRIRKSFPDALVKDLVFCSDYAATQLVDEGVESAICYCAGITEFPGVSPQALTVWKGLATLLVTNGGTWRKQVNKRIGFPSGQQSQPAEAKKRIQALLAVLYDKPDLLFDLNQVLSLPQPEYSDDQWLLLAALLELLPVAVAELQLVFRNYGRVDYAEVAQRATDALGQCDQPSDLALALDYRIRHILVDEFQDTSHTQFQLLERLTAGWQKDDGRSLFLVGDPMQSIYRFREADVGLFLHASAHGVGSVALQPLTLTMNFRSSANIVDWINRTFSTVLPTTTDSVFGSVPYSPASAINEGQENSGATFHPFVGGHLEVQESALVLDLIKAARQRDPEGSVAVLVRNRSHLFDLIPALRQAGLKYKGVKIEPLVHRAVIQDLLALTRALLHPFDRVAWLAILRAPWCGLTLADLLELAGDSTVCILESLSDQERLMRLSEDGGRRVVKVHGVLKKALAQRGRASFRQWVEGVWVELGGPACVDETDLGNAGVFFGVLDELAVAGDLPDIRVLLRAVKDLWAQPDLEADERLQVMTIHAAKGLEFDTVIVPGLGRRPRPSARRLLLWSEIADIDGAHDLLLAPLRITESEDPAYRYLRQIDQQKSAFELGRLLYVACTRARKQLHLLGQVGVNKNGEPATPSKTSLLNTLWPMVGDQFQSLHVSMTEGAGPQGVKTKITRLPIDWKKPSPKKEVLWWGSDLAPDQAGHNIEYDWAGETARVIGVLVHKILCLIAIQGLQQWNSHRISSHHKKWRHQLQALGLPDAEISAALSRIEQSLYNILVDKKAAWILDRAHQRAENELDLTAMFDGRYKRVIVDRTFIDDQGVRWIIDYKTSAHGGGDVQQFLDQEQARYRQQLDQYAQLMQNMGLHPIRLGLYFPLLKSWREWPYQG